MSSLLIVPELGKGKKRKKSLRDGMAAKLAAAKKQKKAAGEFAEQEHSEEVSRCMLVGSCCGLPIWVNVFQGGAGPPHKGFAFTMFKNDYF